MSAEPEQSQEIDLDRTDRLPILQGVMFDPDVEDDIERLDMNAAGSMPSMSASLVTSNTSHEFLRPNIDLPSLADSVRSVEERIARQTAEYESLSRSYELSCAAESAASSRVVALERDLMSARAAVETEHNRLRDAEKTAMERGAFVETARTQVDEATRERDRVLTEGQTLRESLATRDATIVQILHSLGERDTQLATLQQEHVKAAASLESRNQTSLQLEAKLTAARTELAARSSELLAHRDKVVQLSAQLKRSDTELNTLRRELAETRTQSTAYLELLRTREWRHGFDQNLYRELDARVGAADTSHSAMKVQRDQLHSNVANLDKQIAAQQATIKKLQVALRQAEASVEQMAKDSSGVEQARETLQGQLRAAEEQGSRLRSELSWTENALSEARATAGDEAKRATQVIAAANKAHAEHAALLTQREAEHTSQVECMQADRSTQLSQLIAQHKATLDRLHTERDHALAQIRADRETQLARMREQHEATVTKLAREAEARDQEMAVLLAHLQEARRPIEVVEAEVKRVQDQLTAQQTACDQLTDENRELRATLERTRGALEEREFLIRRLERSESNNANVLGRIATSMERLGARGAPVQSAASLPPPASEPAGEFIRMDGDRQTSHSLARRTRIGRATGCELQIDSSSVSRHHAVVLAGPREAIIEDLNSTNGVIVNGRKVGRQLLRDGDVILIGEVKFRYALNAGNRPLEVGAASGSEPSDAPAGAA